MTPEPVRPFPRATAPFHRMTPPLSLVELMVDATAGLAGPPTDGARAAPRAPTRAVSLAETVAASPSADEAKAALLRVLASATFQHSARHRAFLRYVVESTLAGRARAVKEVVIGLDVFGRDLDGFDPRRDSIVRVEARRLRKKLRSYYDTEGRQDPVEIRLETGGYVPTFVFRRPERAAGATAPLILVLPFVTGDDRRARVLATGICDQVTHSVGVIDGLRVMATFNGSQARPVTDGWDKQIVPEDLDYVVDGSVTHMGSRWRCVAHLTSIRDGMRRWSKSFDFVPAEGDPVGEVDLFALQDCVADALVAAMRLEIARIA